MSEGTRRRQREKELTVQPEDTVVMVLIPRTFVDEAASARALLREIALSGVEYEGSDLMHVQIDRETWDEVQRVAGREKE